MKPTKRDIYLSEFEKFTYKQRFYYIWANEIKVNDFNINKYPWMWCIMDLLKVMYFPVLYLILFPFLIFPCSFYLAFKLKEKYKNESEKGWYISNQWIIE